MAIELKFTRKLLYQMCLFTLLGFGLLGYLIYTLSTGNHFSEMLIDHKPFFEQVLIGAGAAITGIAAVLGVSQFNIKNDAAGYLADMLKKIDPNIHEIIFFSFCAAVGEEILFRGAIQHWIGIWPTAFLFVAVHGYLSIKNIGLTLTGLVLVAFSGLLGYLMVNYGITAAMVAHFLYDVVSFYTLKLDDD